MPASFKVWSMPLGGGNEAFVEVMDPDFGEAAIGWVALLIPKNILVTVWVLLKLNSLVDLPSAMDAPASGVPDTTDSLPLPGLPTKRHNHPSVRLGEIGAQSAASSAVAAVIPSK
ncbi:hypothetical protein QJS10_CPA06g01393 [Acorus calamus]|uniref:Uncharacterized protein n=1 Tax=Acorus calamus TaxID=4465 RepID=A0AAV9ELV2_ACOCL|nr:hypothetical protein QJS10_CPA06g01393 [Acorus calamus]